MSQSNPAEQFASVHDRASRHRVRPPCHETNAQFFGHGEAGERSLRGAIEPDRGVMGEVGQIALPECVVLASGGEALSQAAQDFSPLSGFR